MPSLFDYGGRFEGLACQEIENSNFMAYTPVYLLINKNRSPLLSGPRKRLFLVVVFVKTMVRLVACSFLWQDPTVCKKADNSRSIGVNPE